MKTVLSIVLIVTFLIHASMQERETLGERISYGIASIRGEQVAFADSRRMSAEISPSAVVNHINHLRNTIAQNCPDGLRLLSAASTTYKSSVVDLDVNEQLTQQVRKMCP